MYCEMQSLKRSLFICLVFIAFGKVSAQETDVKATIDKYEYLIGDHIKLDLEAKLPKNWKAVFPALSDTLENFEIVEVSDLDTLIQENSNFLKITQKITLTQFDSGSYQIPQLTFIFDPGKEELGEFIPKRTNPIPITVNTVEIDTTKGFIDIKSNLEPEFSIWEYKNEIYIALSIIVFIAILFFIWNKYFKNRRSEEVAEEDFDPAIEPHILAIGSLKKLEEKQLWQNGKIKQYYTELTDVLRIYIKRCFKIEATEMTSDEIISSFSYKRINSELIDKLRLIFTTADFVKFAKAKPVANENEEALTLATNFVNGTIPFSLASMKKEPQSEEKVEPNTEENKEEANNVQ